MVSGSTPAAAFPSAGKRVAQRRRGRRPPQSWVVPRSPAVSGGVPAAGDRAGRLPQERGADVPPKFREGKPTVDFVKLEEKIISFWRERDIFRKSVEKPAPKGRWVGYEGPATANGNPGVQ